MPTGTLFALLWVLLVPFIAATPAQAAATDFPAPTITFGGTTDDEAMTAPVGLAHPTRARVPAFEVAGPLASPEPPRLTWGDFAHDAAPSAPGSDEDAQAQRHRPVAVQYSNAYAVRAKIHKWGSYATLPLFGAQAVLGVQLDQGTTSEVVRATHAGIATAMVGLFTVNGVTGLWNMWDARKDPNGRKRRLTHGFLMLGADAGFVATGLLAPTNDGGGNPGLHKTVAFTSIGVATAGYLLMLFTN